MLSKKKKLSQFTSTLSLLKLSHHTTPTPPKFSTPHTLTFPINMSTISASNKFFITTTDTFSSITTTPPPNFPKFHTFHQPKLFPKLLPTPTPHLLTHSSRKSLTPAFSKSSEEAEELSAEPEDEWLNKLPDKKKPLYSHSLPCIEAWLRSLGFYQSKEDRAVWLVEKPEWHAQLSLDITDLYIRYMKSGPGSLEKDVERRFSYALSREDIENAVLGGP